MKLEIPLNSQRRIPEEGLVAGGVGVIDEIVAELPLSTYAEVFREVIPQLRLREDDQTSMTISLLATPEIDEARKAQFFIEEVQTPHTHANKATGFLLFIAVPLTFFTIISITIVAAIATFAAINEGYVIARAESSHT